MWHLPIANLTVMEYHLAQVKPAIVYTIAEREQLPSSKGSFPQMLEALGVKETGMKPGPNQYKFESGPGYIGKYQFCEALLIDLGYYKADVYYGKPGVSKNFWRGQWTGKKGIHSKSQFLNSPQAQESAIREAFELYWSRLKDMLKKEGKSIKSFLGQKKTLPLKGTSKTVTITVSGILAGSHLQGPDGMANLLLKNQVSHDGNNTSISEYVYNYGGYETPVKDVTSPSPSY